tara:strand:- start:617 stop:1225 length:609 start_codon:yes stop_codon:yes gene_type:complete
MGFLFCTTVYSKDVLENFNTNNNCFDLLVRKGKEIHLINKNKSLIPGVNPIRFNNLEEYAEFVEWQKSMNIDCPVLYFQESYDSQNNKSYRRLQDPLEPNAGMPNVPPQIQSPEPETLLTDANRDDNVFNVNTYAGFDPQDQYIGSITPLDKFEHADAEISPNPMDTNWGGNKFTQNLIKKGYYKDRSRDIIKERKNLGKVL